MQTPDLPSWLTRGDCVRARVQLTETDHVTILALPAEEVGGVIERLAGLAEGTEDLEAVLPVVDTVLTRAIETWEWPTIRGTYELIQGHAEAGGAVLADWPSDERMALWRRLPMSALLRLVEGVVTHSGNS